MNQWPRKEAPGTQASNMPAYLSTMGPADRSYLPDVQAHSLVVLAWEVCWCRAGTHQCPGLAH